MLHLVCDMAIRLMDHLDVVPRYQDEVHLSMDHLDARQIQDALHQDDYPTLEDARQDEVDGWQVDVESRHRFVK